MKKAIEMLDEVKESIMNAYEIKSGLARDKISKMMDAETWMNANKALEYGFIDGILQRESIPDDAGAQPFAMQYSETAAVNSLAEKIAAKSRIEPKAEPVKTETRIEAESLLDRLNLMKNWR